MRRNTHTHTHTHIYIYIGRALHTGSGNENNIGAATPTLELFVSYSVNK